MGDTNFFTNSKRLLGELITREIIPAKDFGRYLRGYNTILDFIEDVEKGVGCEIVCFVDTPEELMETSLLKVYLDKNDNCQAGCKSIW